MIAKYRPAESPELVVELWEAGKGFELHLTFESGYVLDIQHRDSLVAGISRFEGDDFLDGGPGTDNLNGGPGVDKCLNAEQWKNCDGSGGM